MSDQKLAEAARALAVNCKNRDSYRNATPDSTFLELVDDVLMQTQHVSDNAVDEILAELAKADDAVKFASHYQGPQARKIARDLHRAMHPKGMHTNGPTMIQVEASHLYVLLNRWRNEKA